MANNSADDDDRKDDLEGESSDDEGADKENVDEEGDDDGDAEPKTRHNLSSMIARKNRTIDKLKSRIEEGEGGEEEVDEDVEDQVGRALRKSIAPIAKDLDEKHVGLEISTFLAEPKNAKFKKFENQARRYALHPAYANVPIDGIFKQLAFDSVAGESENDEASRREKSQRQNARGSSFRQAPQSDADKIRKVTFRDENFKSIRDRIAAGETINLAEE